MPRSALDPGQDDFPPVDSGSCGSSFGVPSPTPGWLADKAAWVPPVDGADPDEVGVLAGLVTDQAANEQPVQRNLLLADEPSHCEHGVPGQARSLSETQLKQAHGIPGSADSGRSGMPTAEPNRRQLAAGHGAEVIVRGCIPAPILVASPPAARTSAMLIPVGVLVLGVGIAGFSSAIAGDHIMAGIAVGLGVVGALLIRVFLRG